MRDLFKLVAGVTIIVTLTTGGVVIVNRIYDHRDVSLMLKPKPEGSLSENSNETHRPAKTQQHQSVGGDSEEDLGQETGTGLRLKRP